MHAQATTTVRTARMILGIAQSLGADAAAMLTDLHVESGTLLNPDARLTHETLVALWHRAVGAVDEADLTLRMMSAIDFGAIAALPFECEYLALQLFTASPTVASGIQRYVRNFALVHEGAAFEITHDAGSVRVRLVPSPGTEWPRGLLGWFVVVCAQLALRTASVPLDGFVLHLAVPSSPKLATLPAALGVPVVFGAHETAFTLAEQALDVPLRSSNPSLLAAVDRRAAEALARLAPDRAFVNRARSVVVRTLEEGAPARRVAAALGASVRTFSRRLEAAGTSHRALVDDVRIELARRYLLDEPGTIDEIAFRLGFSGSTAFIRAFRRWFGCSPTEFRRTRAALAANTVSRTG